MVALRRATWSCGRSAQILSQKKCCGCLGTGKGVPGILGQGRVAPGMGTMALRPLDEDGDADDEKLDVTFYVLKRPFAMLYDAFLVIVVILVISKL